MPVTKTPSGRRNETRRAESAPAAAGPGSGSAPPPAINRSEYGILSLIDLSQGLTATVDLFRAADILLVNLMGQFGTARALLWLVTDDPPGDPALIRSYGLSTETARAVSGQCAASWLTTVRRQGAAITPEPRGHAHEAEVVARLRQADLALVAPLGANGATLGMVALGHRADGAEYGDLDIQILEASLGIAGIALQNGAIHNRLLESNRLLRIANEDLKDVDRMKSEFLGNVNHELRTPLAVIVPSLEHVLEGDLDIVEVRSLLTASAVQARRLVAVVENLLTLSELGQDNLSLRIVERDLAPYLAAFHAERLPGVSAGLRDFCFEVEEGALHAQFDEHRLRQILDALVDNAVKFTPPGSRIILGADTLTRDGVRWARIRVEDNGPGIPPEKLGSLFEAFHQLDGSTTRRVGGLGIGLSLARDLASRMGGRLVASSDQERGSTFSVLLKVASH